MTNVQMRQQFSTMFSEKLMGNRTFNIVRPNTLINNGNSSIPDSAIEGQGGTVACPSCNMKFPLNQIEQHADACCVKRNHLRHLYMEHGF